MAQVQQQPKQQNLIDLKERLVQAKSQKRISALREKRRYTGSSKQQALSTQMKADRLGNLGHLGAKGPIQEEEEGDEQEMMGPQESMQGGVVGGERLGLGEQIQAAQQTNRIAQKVSQQARDKAQDKIEGMAEDAIGKIIKQGAPKLFGAVGISTDASSWVSFFINCFQYIPTITWELTRAVVGTYMLKGQSKIIPPVDIYPFPNVKELVFAYTMFLLMCAFFIGLMVLFTMTFFAVGVGIALKISTSTFGFIITNMGALSWLPIISP